VLRAAHAYGPRPAIWNASAIIASGQALGVMMAKPNCLHRRTQLIAEDNDSRYVECLECGEILESAEMEKVEKKDAPGFDESLSDA
jgi:hypothetical protein